MGWCKFERGWLDSEMFEGAPYDERSAWAWMIGEANWEDGFKGINGQRIALKRGQFTASIRFMADKFGWSTNRVLRFIQILKKWHSVETATETGQTIVTVVNYSKYQDEKAKTRNSNGDTGGDSNGDKLEELKEVEEVKNKLFVEEFEVFFSNFPRKRRGARDKAFKAYKAARSRATIGEINAGLMAYIESDEVARGYAKGCAAWLNDDRWSNDYRPPKQSAGKQDYFTQQMEAAARGAK
jgi:hypothetical protein